MIVSHNPSLLNFKSFHKNSTQTELILVIENLLKSEQDHLNKELKIEDLAEEHSNFALNYHEEWKTYTNNNDWKGKGIQKCNGKPPTFKEIQ